VSLRILQVINSINPAGGGPIEGIKQSGTALVAEGHGVEIASLDPPDAPYGAQCSLPVHALGPATLRYGFASRLIPWLRANRSRYDFVVVNGIWQYHSFGTWRALRHSSTPYVVFTHGMLDPWFKKQYPLKHLKKWMYWPWAEYRVLRDARAVLFTCEEERRLAHSSFWLYRCNEVVVGYGTGKPTGDPRIELQEFFARYPDLKGKKLALFMGRIHPKKGCDLLIEAFANVLRSRPDWHLVLAGPDEIGWREKLDYRAAQLGLAPRMTWTGMLSGTLKWGALRASEVFVLPSHQENFGMAVAEALAAGVPALISNKVNIWREIEADGAGMIFDDNLEGICRSLHSYLEIPAKKKIAMRQAAAECFEQRFEIKKVAQALHAALGQCQRSDLDPILGSPSEIEPSLFRGTPQGS
jgi:glycosyltransferase involved in cell wall biosynthesis